MANTAHVESPGEAAVVTRRPVPSRLVAPGEPAAVVEALLGALHRGEITSKFAREALVRLVPAAKATVHLRLPQIVDAKSYARACRHIMKASSTGRVNPSDAATLLRNAKATFQAVAAANRTDFLTR